MNANTVEQLKMAEWKEYTGSDDQIADIEAAFTNHGFIIKKADGTTSFGVIKGRLALTKGFIESHFLGQWNVTHYLICEPHQRADMICQQARTGQPVWIRYEWRDSTGPNTETFVTNTPDWNIPNAEYRFTPFEE